jgi:hypothetical protein
VDWSVEVNVLEKHVSIFSPEDGTRTQKNIIMNREDFFSLSRSWKPLICSLQVQKQVITWGILPLGLSLTVILVRAFDEKLSQIGPFPFQASLITLLPFCPNPISCYFHI